MNGKLIAKPRYARDKRELIVNKNSPFANAGKKIHTGQHHSVTAKAQKDEALCPEGKE